MWLTPGLQAQTHSTVSLPQLPPGPLPLCFGAGLLVRGAGPGEGCGTACGAQLGAWGEAAEAAGLEVPLLSWAGGGDAQEAPQARRPQPSWESAGRDNLWSVSEVPNHMAPSLQPSLVDSTPSPAQPRHFRHPNTPLLVVNHSWILLWASLLLDWGSSLVFISLVFGTVVRHLGQCLLNGPRCLWGGRAPTLSHRGSADGCQGFQSLSHLRAPGRHEQGRRAPSSGHRVRAQLRAGCPLVDIACTCSSGPGARGGKTPEPRRGAQVRSLCSWLGRRLFPSSLSSPQPDSSLPSGRQEGYYVCLLLDPGRRQSASVTPGLRSSQRQAPSEKGQPQGPPPSQRCLPHLANTFLLCGVREHTYFQRAFSLVPSAQPGLTLSSVYPQQLNS